MLDLANMPKEKQKLVTIGLIVVIVGVAGYLLYANVFAGSGQTASAPEGMPIDPSVVGGPSLQPPGTVPGMMPPMPGAPDPTANGAAPVAPPAQPAPTPVAPSQPVSAPSSPSQPASNGAPRSIVLFGSVTVTYPQGWGVGMGSSPSSAVLSDGKGRFEVQAPDPKASDAKAIAVAAATKITGKVPGSQPQGQLKVAGYDAYFYMIGDKRIIGVDAPTRIVLVEYAKGASYSAYKPTFDKMESELKFR